MALRIEDLLPHTTVRLECTTGEGRRITGTAFLLELNVGGHPVPLLVTNKHVVEAAAVGDFVLTKADENGDPLVGQVFHVTLREFAAPWLRHPDKDVDLAVMPMGPLLTHLRTSNAALPLFLPWLPQSAIGTGSLLESLSGIEEITMIGYPNGIWDVRNNMPIVRRGVTATNPRYDYNGLPIFVIDCACFPGSSGSPVFVFNRGAYTNSQGTLVAGGHRLILVGVLYAGPQHVAEGEVQTIEVPLQQMTIALSRIPNNLGFVVKAAKLLDFEPILADIIAREHPAS